MASGQQQHDSVTELALLTLLLKIRESSRASGSAGARGARLSRQTFRLRVVEHRRVGVQTLGHLVADEVDEALEDRRHVDVVFGGRLVKLQT